MGTARYNLPSSNDNNLTPYNSSSTTVVRAVKHNCIKPSNWFLMLYWWLSNAHRFARCMIQSRLWRRSHRIVSPLFFSRQVLEVIILFFEYPRYTWSLQHDAANRPIDLMHHPTIQHNNCKQTVHHRTHLAICKLWSHGTDIMVLWMRLLAETNECGFFFGFLQNAEMLKLQ